jgi:hypothetical protein
MSASGNQRFRRARRLGWVGSDCRLLSGAYVDACGGSCLLLDLLLRESVALIRSALNGRGHSRWSRASGGGAHTCGAAGLFWDARTLAQWHVRDERMVDSVVGFEAAVRVPS